MCEDCGSADIDFIFDWYRDPEWMPYDPKTLEGDEGEFDIFRILKDTYSTKDPENPGYLHLVGNDIFENLRFDEEIQSLPTGRYRWKGTVQWSRDHYFGDYDEVWYADSVKKVKSR